MEVKQGIILEAKIYLAEVPLQQYFLYYATHAIEV